MKPLPEPFGALLALREGDTLSEEPLIDDTPPDDGRGQGFVQASLPAAHDLITFWQKHPESAPMPPPPGLSWELRRSVYDPCLFWLEMENAALLPLGEALRGEAEEILLDSRDKPAGARVAGPGFELLVLAERGRLRAFPIHRAPLRLPPTTPGEKDPFILEVPDLGYLLGEDASQSGPLWLQEQAARLLHSSSFLERVAAVGLVGRLWTPAPEALPRAIEEAFEDKESPIERATLWAQGISPQTLKEVERAALAEVRALSAQLEGLHQQMTERADAPATARLLAEDILRRRDDLESVAFVLRAARAGAHLETALNSFDEEAEANLSLFAFLEDIELDERLSAVSWQEPLAWWGSLFSA